MAQRNTENLHTLITAADRKRLNRASGRTHIPKATIARWGLRWILGYIESGQYAREIEDHDNPTTLDRLDDQAWDHEDEMDNPK